MSRMDDLKTFLRFQSVSCQHEHDNDTAACADWLVAKLSSIGFDATAHKTARHPIVVARSPHVPNKPHLLIYGHYDVMPIDPANAWESDPFEADVRDGRIYARGASDDKGEIMAHILAAEELLRDEGSLPVNITYLFEGEEEMGSGSLHDFLPDHKELLDCDVIVVSDTGMAAPDVPTFSYGLKGLSCCEVEVSGPAMDLHSGMFGGAVANPITTLCEMIASCHDADGHVLVEDFYDGVADLKPWERKMWEHVPGMDNASLADLTGVPALQPEQGYTGAECIYARPTFELNGISGGYEGEGSKTVIPTHARAKISCRLVPGQDPDRINDLIRCHFEKVAPQGVRVKVTPQHGGAAYMCNPHSPYGKAAQKALEETFGNPPVLVREGGSIPIIAEISTVLGKDALLLGLDLPDARIHSPNENMRTEIFEKGIAMAKNLMHRLGELN